MNESESLEACYQQYLNRAQFSSQHTQAAYARSIELFFDFLLDRYRINATQAAPIGFTQNQLDILIEFANWLASPGDHTDNRPYAPATIELRIAGVQHWLQFMESQHWLSNDFPVEEASHRVHQLLKSQRADIEKAVDPVEDLEPVVCYYDTQQPPKALLSPKANPDRRARWELTRLRNRALLYCLAESGGRVSELLSLNVYTFADQRVPLCVEVIGKGGHHYVLKLHKALPPIHDYLHKRALRLNTENARYIPLFVSHDPRYDGSRMSRVVAWRVVHRAAHALGLQDVSPHDFRHWRALQLIQEGQPLETIQDMLGHRSIETVRALYAHLTESKEAT